jgi:hypothetical protein
MSICDCIDDMKCDEFTHKPYYRPSKTTCGKRCKCIIGITACPLFCVGSACLGVGKYAIGAYTGRLNDPEFIEESDEICLCMGIATSIMICLRMITNEVKVHPHNIDYNDYIYQQPIYVYNQDKMVNHFFMDQEKMVDGMVRFDPPVVKMTEYVSESDLSLKNKITLKLDSKRSLSAQIKTSPFVLQEMSR